MLWLSFCLRYAPLLSRRKITLGEQQGEKYKAPRILYIVGGLLDSVFLGCYTCIYTLWGDYQESKQSKAK